MSLVGSCRRCRRIPRALDRGRAAGHYQDALRDIVHAFKYEGRRSLAAPLAALMRRQAGALLDGVDWIVPVPLHWKRERERGFNQATDLARSLLACGPSPSLSPRVAGRGDTTHGPRLLHALRRVRHTTVQADLPAARRHKNVRDAFALSVGAMHIAYEATEVTRRAANYLAGREGREAAGPHTMRLRRGEGAAMRALAGSIVLLVDDVSTTGATIDACARVLKDAGVKEVRAITAARVVTRPSR